MDGEGTPAGTGTEIASLEMGISALEAQRAALGDAVVDALLTPVREKLAALKAHRDSSERRRQVTVLFADAAGFTALSERYDPEDVRNWMNGAFDRLDAVILAHGGTIDKHIGDAVMALWGADSTREDDPERAIRAALAMQAELEAFRREWSFPLAMRIAIDTGSVVLGSIGTTGESTAFGDSVNLASRLEKAAPAGGVLITHDTYRQVRGVFDVQAQPPLQVRGKAEPVQTYIVQRPKPRAFRLRTRGVEGVETRMIGREAEFARLRSEAKAAWERASPRAVTIVGEAGVGKSRLLYEFQNWVELMGDGVRVLRGRASEGTPGLPYALLRDVLAQSFAIADSDSPAMAREKLERGVRTWVAKDPEAAMKAHFLGHLIGLDYSFSPHLEGILDDPRQIRDRAFHYLTQFFSSSDGPIALLLEDVHWADEGSLDAVAHLRREGNGLPLVTVCLTRPSLYERRPGWKSDLRIDLGPLSDGESRLLAEEILQKVPQVPQALRELLVSGAEGNPFYMEELVKMLIDQRVILPSPEAWSVEPSRLVAVRLPPTLTGVLQARLDGLPAESRAVCQRAAVVGRIFWDRAISALGAGGAGDPSAALDDLCARELIFRRAASTFDGATEYIFKHALLRDVAYEGVLRRVRRQYHQAAALWLVESSRERADEFAGLIAEHFEKAERSSDAIPWYGRAGRASADASAPELAVGFYRKALALAESATAPAPRMSVWYGGLGEALLARAKYAEAAEAFGAMRACAEAAGDDVAQAEAWNGLAQVQDRQGHHQVSLESAKSGESAARRGLESARPGSRARDAAPAVLAETLFRRGSALYHLGDAAGAIALGEQVLAVCDTFANARGARRGRARSFSLLGGVNNMLGRFDEADRLFARARQIYEQLGDRRGVAAMLNNLGANQFFRGDYAGAAERYGEALVIIREIGHRAGELVFLSNLGGAKVGLGDYEGAEVDLRQVIAMAGTGGAIVRPDTFRFLAEACLGQGKSAEALEEVRRALELGEETGHRELIGEAWRVLGNCGLQIPDLAVPVPGTEPTETRTARECYAASRRIFEEIGAEAQLARTLRDWSLYELAAGERPRGEELLREARALFTRLDLPLEVARADAVLP